MIIESYEYVVFRHCTYNRSISGDHENANVRYKLN